MSRHASKRALEYYGAPLSWADQGAMLDRIDRGGGARLRCLKGGKLPIYVLAWPRIGSTIAAVVNEQKRRIVTVLPPDCGEIAWRFERLFGRRPSLQEQEK